MKISRNVVGYFHVKGDKWKKDIFIFCLMIIITDSVVKI